MVVSRVNHQLELCLNERAFKSLMGSLRKWLIFFAAVMGFENYTPHQKTIASHCFENLIWIFQFWHFSAIFAFLKMTCLVTLFDRIFRFSETRQKWTMANETFSVIFKHCDIYSTWDKELCLTFLWQDRTQLHKYRRIFNVRHIC